MENKLYVKQTIWQTWGIFELPFNNRLVEYGEFPSETVAKIKLNEILNLEK